MAQWYKSIKETRSIMVKKQFLTCQIIYCTLSILSEMKREKKRVKMIVKTKENSYITKKEKNKIEGSKTEIGPVGYGMKQNQTP